MFRSSWCQPSRGRCWSGAHWSSRAPGQTSGRSWSEASTTSRRIRRTKSAPLCVSSSTACSSVEQGREAGATDFDGRVRTAATAGSRLSCRGPLHDVWAVDLPRMRSGITLDEFLRTAGASPFTPSPIVRVLLNIRLFVGRRLGWDREQDLTVRETFATRLTPADLSRTLARAGTREGPFRMVYRFENEQLLELINRTAHAAALSALVETASAYRFYFGVYVCSVGRWTPVYMALIDPFRKLIVYPSLLRSVRRTWSHTFGTG